MEKVSIPGEAVVELIERLLKFPYPQICRHYVAGMLLETLEKNGAEISSDLAQSIVRAEDERALELIRQ